MFSKQVLTLERSAHTVLLTVFVSDRAGLCLARLILFDWGFQDSSLISSVEPFGAFGSFIRGPGPPHRCFQYITKSDSLANDGEPCKCVLQEGGEERWKIRSLPEVTYWIIVSVNVLRLLSW